MVTMLAVLLAFMSAGGQGVFEPVAPGVYRYADSCNVYVLLSGKEAVLIESGLGSVREHLKELGVERVAWILHTHAHRDLCRGDESFVKTSTQVAVPEGTQAFFAEAEEGWRRRLTYYGYSYGPKYFLPLRDVPVAKTLSDGEVFAFKDIALRVVRTPGHTGNHMAYVLERNGRRYGFTGDVTCAPGQLWELDALQSSYEEFIQGAPSLVRVPELLHSIQILRDEKLDMLLPAHGTPYTECDSGLASLAENLSVMMKTLCGNGGFNSEDAPDLSLPGIETLRTGACQYLVEDANGHGLLFDSGFATWDNGTKLLTRALEKRTSLKKIDAVTVSHYHMDHIATVRAMVDHYGAKVYAHEVLQSVLQRPDSFFLPCLQMQPIRVDRTFADGGSFTWRGKHFTFYHFPGQTYWHQAVLGEIEGNRILFTGDSIDNYDHIRCIDTWNYNPISDTDGAIKCVDVLERTRPDFLATGHWGIRRWKPECTEDLRRFIRERNAVLTKLIGQEDPNLGYDVHWAEADPFRSVARPGGKIELAVRVRNHLGRAETAELRLVAPDGWRVFPELQRNVVDAKGCASFNFTVQVPRDSKKARHLLGVDVTLAGRSYGELGMAVVDIGGRHDPELESRELFPLGIARDDYGYF